MTEFRCGEGVGKGTQLVSRIGGVLWIRSYSQLGLILPEGSWRRSIFAAGIVNFLLSCVERGCDSSLCVAINFSFEFESVIRNLMFYGVLFGMPEWM